MSGKHYVLPDSSWREATRKRGRQLRELKIEADALVVSVLRLCDDAIVRMLGVVARVTVVVRCERTLHSLVVFLYTSVTVLSFTPFFMIYFFPSQIHSQPFRDTLV